MDNAQRIPSEKQALWGYKIDPRDIKQVILGCRMNGAHKEYIRNILEPYNIEIIMAKPDPSRYKLKFQSYDAKKEVNVVYNLGMDV